MVISITTSPLFASATKFNYTTAIAHFLSTIATYPNLKKNYDCCSFKVLSSFYFYFRYFKVLVCNLSFCRFWDHLDSDMLKKFWDYLCIKMNLARIQTFIVDFNSAINGCEFLEFQEKELIRSPLNKIAFLRTTSLDLVLLNHFKTKLNQ
ncbi:unnamed protein product [Rhizophagus irregularis]|nr:unnamed protein product [Rhizophagus irregularis]